MQAKKSEKTSKLFYFWSWLRYYAKKTRIFFVILAPIFIIFIWYDPFADPKTESTLFRILFNSILSLIIVIVTIAEILKLKLSWESCAYSFEIIESRVGNKDREQS